MHKVFFKNHAFKKWQRNFLCHCCLQRNSYCLHWNFDRKKYDLILHKYIYFSNLIVESNYSFISPKLWNFVTSEINLGCIKCLLCYVFVDGGIQKLRKKIWRRRTGISRCAKWKMVGSLIFLTWSLRCLGYLVLATKCSTAAHSALKSAKKCNLRSCT